MHRYYLMAQAQLRSTIVPGQTILKSLDMEYMGSAEFEFGAIPKALADFLVCDKPKFTSEIKIKMPERRTFAPVEDIEVTVHYWVRAEQREDLEHMLTNWKQSKLEFKEWDVGLQQPSDVIFCIDKGFECFIWRSPEVAAMLLSSVRPSVEALIKAEWLSQAEGERLLALSDSNILYK